MDTRVSHFVDRMDVEPTDRILEIGCGHGVAATLVCKKLTTGNYLAVDRSQKMIDAAIKRNYAFVEDGKAEFLLAELETLELGEKRFDKIFAMRVGLFYREPERAHDIVKRWLAPKGRIFVAYDEP